MEKIKFYSESDMICKSMLDNIIEMIKNEMLNHEWSFEDVANHYNALKYLKYENFRNYIFDNMDLNINLTEYENLVKRKINEHINKHKTQFLDQFEKGNHIHQEDYFEILEKYKVYSFINNQEFNEFLTNNKHIIETVLNFKRIVEHFKDTLKESILEDCINAEIIISTTLEHNSMYLPSSLSNEDKTELIHRYILSDNPNINFLRRIITCHKNKLVIPDRIKVLAERKIKNLEKSFFKDGEGIEASVSVNFTNEISEPIVLNMKSAKADIKVNISWIEDNLDFPTLFNNLIYLFNIVDTSMRVTLVSKNSETGIFESFSSDKADYLFNRNFSFSFKEMTSEVMLYGYFNFLRAYNIRVEDMIAWFFNEYVVNEFGIRNFSIHLPAEETSYLEKCRTILPEIEAVLKQYALYVEYNEIDQELIQISTFSVKYNEYKSLISKKYVYPTDEWIYRAMFLLFSNQSHIFYIEKLDKKYKNFYELVRYERLIETDFQDYQIRGMKWLFDNNIIHFNSEGILQFSDLSLIFILKEFFNNEVINYWRCPIEVCNKLDKLLEDRHIEVENSLFSRGEQDLFNYYLDNSKFTNGLSIRNRYMHGTNTNDLRQHESHYFIIIKLLIIICIKINDDLCINDYLVNDKRKEKQ